MLRRSIAHALRYLQLKHDGVEFFSAPVLQVVLVEHVHAERVSARDLRVDILLILREGLTIHA